MIPNILKSEPGKLRVGKNYRVYFIKASFFIQCRIPCVVFVHRNEQNMQVMFYCSEMKKS